MGISGIGPGSLLLILAIILLIFGTKRLRNMGGDLGGALKGFKKAMSDDEQNKSPASQDPLADKENDTHQSKVTESEKQK